MNTDERSRLVRAQSILADVYEATPFATDTERILELKRRVNNPECKPIRRVGEAA